MGIGVSILDIKEKLATGLDVERLMYNAKTKFLDESFPPNNTSLGMPITITNRKKDFKNEDKDEYNNDDYNNGGEEEAESPSLQEQEQQQQIVWKRASELSYGDSHCIWGKNELTPLDIYCNRSSNN